MNNTFEMYEMLEGFIKPELLILIPVLYLFGMALKKSQMADRYIPLILGAISIALSFLYIGATTSISGTQEVFMMIFTASTQGILCAGASVYVNQIVKQLSKDE